MTDRGEWFGITYEASDSIDGTVNIKLNLDDFNAMRQRIAKCEKVGDGLEEVVVEIVKILADCKENVPRMNLLITNQCMKIQRLAEQLGVFYVDLD